MDASQAGWPEAGLRRQCLISQRLTSSRVPPCLRRGAYREAENYLREVIRIWPAHAGALNNLGTSIWQQGRIPEAEELLSPGPGGGARRLRRPEQPGQCPVGAGPARRGGRTLQAGARAPVRLGRDADEPGSRRCRTSASSTRPSTGWNRRSDSIPTSPEALDNIGMTLARQGKWDEAMVWYERALAVRPDFPEAHRNRSYHLADSRGLRAGMAGARVAAGLPQSPDPARTAPAMDGRGHSGANDPAARRAGSLGDVLQFIRFAPAVKRRGARVIVACPEPLMRLVCAVPGGGRRPGLVRRRSPIATSTPP